MKIKKSDLIHIIEGYINEQVSAPERPAGGAYPANIKTDDQKQQYNILHTADKRRIDHPDSEVRIRWPQDFVLFEEQFADHVANWRLFKREYPKSAFVLQLFDLSGVSGYGDLAESIEAVAVGNPSTLDQAIFGLNILAASPIGLVMGLFGGRLGLKVVNGAATAIQKGETNGLKVLGELMKGSTNFGALLKPGAVRSFFNKPQVITILEKTGKEITEETIELCVLNFSKFVKFLDSFGFRAFMKTFLVISENFGNEIQIVILQWLKSEAGQEFIKTSALSRWLFEKAPKEISKYLKSEI